MMHNPIARAIAGITALVALVLVVVGSPIALSQWGTIPELSIQSLLRPDDGTVLLGVITVIGWVAWAVFSLVVVVEVYAQIRRRPIRLPGLGWVQAIVATMIIAIFAMGAPHLPAQANPAQPTAPAVVQTAQSPAPVVRASVADTKQESAPQQWRTHIVEPGDDLWTLAEGYYGDGLQYHTIAAANPIVEDPNVILPGWELQLPGLPPIPAVTSLPSASSEVSPGSQTELARSQVSQVGESLQVTTQIPAATVEMETGQAPIPQPQPELQSVAEVGAADHEVDPLWLLGWGASGLVAASVLAAIVLRRARREPFRDVGHRFVEPDEASQRLESVLRRTAEPIALTDLDRVRQGIAAAFGANIPELIKATVGDEIALTVAGHPPVPAGFSERILGEHTEWRIGRSGFTYLPAPHPEGIRAWPALTCLGRSGSEWLLCDLEREKRISFTGANVEDARLAMLLDLGCSDTVDVLVPCTDADLINAAEFTNVKVIIELDPELRQLEARAKELQGFTVGQARVHPDLAEAARPVVMLLNFVPGGRPAQRIAELQQHFPLIVIAPNLQDSEADLDLDNHVWATREGDLTCVGQKVDPDARTALTRLFKSVDDNVTAQAEWWDHSDLDNVAFLRPRQQYHLPVTPNPFKEPDVPASVSTRHPTLRLLGPIDMVGARGEQPSRAPRQCLEYLAWLLEHPGGRSSEMAQALIVAESTRRSNVSRLRSWLGNDDAGGQYLPEAYSGRIVVSDHVSSDWHRVQMLIAPGINRVSAETLIQALEMVRGAPLADAAPGQWHWAEPMRSEMVATIRDIGARLAELALEDQHLDVVRWATARALAAAPEDEILLCYRVRAEHLAGNRAEVERIVTRMSRHAKTLNVDLADSTVALIQEVIEGVSRSRHVE